MHDFILKEEKSLELEKQQPSTISAYLAMWAEMLAVDKKDLIKELQNWPLFMNKMRNNQALEHTQHQML